MDSISLSRYIFLAALALTPAISQQTSQKIPQFENADVNVWKSIVVPNAPLTIHTHEHPRVIIPLSGGTMKIQYQDGTSEVHQWEKGKAYWLSQEEGKKPHADANIGSQPIEVMVVEIKDAK
jgi:hypothetical protein